MKIYLGIFIIIGLAACAGGKDSNRKPKIEGNWNWTQSSGGFAGITRTPETTKQIKNLQITKDSIFYYENGELKQASPYILKYGKLILPNKNDWYFGDGFQKTHVQRIDSLLILAEDCFDCFTHTYVKMKER